jgi:hypothetical protein
MIEPITKVIAIISGAIPLFYSKFIKQIDADFIRVIGIVATSFVHLFFLERENNFKKYCFSAGKFLFPRVVLSEDTVSEGQVISFIHSRATEKRHYKNQTSIAYLDFGI